jgi:hypothetical protein
MLSILGAYYVLYVRETYTNILSNNFLAVNFLGDLEIRFNNNNNNNNN